MRAVRRQHRYPTDTHTVHNLYYPHTPLDLSELVDLVPSTSVPQARIRAGVSAKLLASVPAFTDYFLTSDCLFLKFRLAWVSLYVFPLTWTFFLTQNFVRSRAHTMYFFWFLNNMKLSFILKHILL